MSICCAVGQQVVGRRLSNADRLLLYCVGGDAKSLSICRQTCVSDEIVESV